MNSLHTIKSILCSLTLDVDNFMSLMLPLLIEIVFLSIAANPWLWEWKTNVAAWIAKVGPYLVWLIPTEYSGDILILKAKVSMGLLYSLFCGFVLKQVPFGEKYGLGSNKSSQQLVCRLCRPMRHFLMKLSQLKSIQLWRNCFWSSFF